jgi:hypothetical protein
MQMKDSRDYGSEAPANANGPTSSSDPQRRGKGTASPANRGSRGTASPVNRKGRGASSRPVSHQGMQRRVPADRGISAYQHEHTTSQRNEYVVRRPLRTVPLVPLEGASDTPRRRESAQAVWAYVGDTGDIAPVTPTAPSFSSGPDEAINVDGLIPAPLDHNTTGVHRYGTPAAPTFSHTDETHMEALATTGVYHYDYDAESDDEESAFPDSGATWSTDSEDDQPPSPKRYRRAYGSISARPRRNPNTDETTHRYGMYGTGGSPANPATPIPPIRTDALAGRNPRTEALAGRNVRTEALAGGRQTAALAADAGYLPTTAPLGSPYNHQHPALALRSRRDTAFLMLLTLLVLSIIGIMSCNYLLSMYHL